MHEKTGIVVLNCFTLADIVESRLGHNWNVYWTKIETLHFLNRNLTNLTQTHYFKTYVYIKALRLTRQPCKKKIKLDQAFMNNVEKTSNCILSLEDYRYEILNM